MFIPTAQHPGPWQYFVQRIDNVGLPIQVVTEKYLIEQLNFDNEYSQYIAYQNWLSIQGKGQPQGVTGVPTGDEIWNLTSTPYNTALGSWDGII